MTDTDDPTPQPITHGPDPFPEGKKGAALRWLERFTERLGAWIEGQKK